MSDFDDRLKRAAKKFTEKSAAEETAREDLEKQRSSFLTSFWDTGHNVIEPELERAQEALAPMDWSDNPPKKDTEIVVSVKWSNNDDRLIFSLSAGTRHAVLVFLADPIKMRVRVLAATTDLARRNSTAQNAIMELCEGTARKTQALAEYTLADVTQEIVQDHTSRFVEQNLG